MWTYVFLFGIINKKVVLKLAISESQKKANLKYAKNHLKRVPLDLQIEFYNDVKFYAEKNGYTVNGLIKELLKEKLNAD